MRTTSSLLGGASCLLVIVLSACAASDRPLGTGNPQDPARSATANGSTASVASPSPGAVSPPGGTTSQPATPPSVGAAVDPEPADGDDWVVVVFTTEKWIDAKVMDLLLETELKAAEAVESAGVGVIDGNEVGAGSYELFFVGSDREAMWRVLKPAFAEAPVKWSRVELRHGFEDPAPRVIVR